MTKHEYFERSLSWASEQSVRDARSRRFAWTVAGVAAGVAFLAVAALALMMPLKTVQPVTILVDRQTGFAETIDPGTPLRVGADEALAQSLLAQYVTAREQFDRATVSNDYRKVGLWSGGNVRRAYLASIPSTSPASPFRRYAPGTVILVRIRSVSKLGPGLSLVRFATHIEDQNGRPSTEANFVATVRYSFSNNALSFEDRLINPLGFQVTGYRVEMEAPDPPTVVVQPVVTQGAVQ